jgi:Phosphotransferase enzyme family
VNRPTVPMPIPLPGRGGDAALQQALDAETMRALVQRHLLRTGEVVALQPDYIRWKDLDGSLVGWRVTVRTDAGDQATYVTARTAPPHRLADEAGRLLHREAEHWAGLGAFALSAAGDLLLLAFPIDRAMHDLRRLVRASKVRSLVASTCPAVVPTGLRFSKSRSRFALVRYKPERRAVLRWQLGAVDASGQRSDAGTIWIRCHAEAQAQRTAIATAAAAAAGVCCPRPLGIHHDRLMIESHLDGSPFAPRAQSASVDAAAATVASLHDSGPVSGLPLYGPVQELDLALRAAEDLGRLLPALEPRALALADRLAARIPAAGPGTLAHGDLHPGQLLINAAGAALCDFDRACVAPVAHDLATFRAHCELADDAGGTALARAFLDAYARHRELPAADELDWWAASALLRGSLGAFRGLRHDWPQRCERALLMAARTLAAAEGPRR